MVAVGADGRASVAEVKLGDLLFAITDGCSLVADRDALKSDVLALVGAWNSRVDERKRLGEVVAEAVARTEELEREIFSGAPLQLPELCTVYGHPVRKRKAGGKVALQFLDDPVDLVKWGAAVESLKAALDGNESALKALDLFVERGIKVLDAEIDELGAKKEAAIKTHDERAGLISSMRHTACECVKSRTQAVRALEGQLADARAKAIKDTKDLVEECAELRERCGRLHRDLRLAEERADAWAKRVQQLEREATPTVRELLEMQQNELKNQAQQLQLLQLRPPRPRAQQPPQKRHAPQQHTPQQLAQQAQLAQLQHQFLLAQCLAQPVAPMLPVTPQPPGSLSPAHP